MVPVSRPLEGAARAAAIRRMMARLRKGADLGGIRVSRDEIYDRIK
jgi:hypothetical protein